MPIPAARCRVSGCSKAFLTCSLSCAITAGGVPAGANSPTQASSSKPGRPASAVVGILGNIGWRVLLVTANPFNLPAWICDITDGGVVMNTWTWPPRTSRIASPEPLYGTWTMSVCVVCSNRAVPTCDSDPLPCEAKLILPGWVLM